MHHPGIYIQHTDNKGRGVFTHAPISKGDIIEICPLIICPSSDTALIHKTSLHDYYFLWGPEQKQVAIALGYGSLYNHSDAANAEFLYDYNLENIKIICLTDIEAGEEILINYITEENPKHKLWFEIKN